MSYYDGKTARNDITGKMIKTGKPTDAYSKGWDQIFGKKEVPPEPKEHEPKENKND